MVMVFRALISCSSLPISVCMVHMDVCSLGFGEVDHVDNKNQTLLHGCLDEADNEADADGSSGLATRLKELNLGQGQQFICVDKLASTPDGASSEKDEELGVALRQLFSQEIALKSAMKGSRAKEGLAPKKLNVTWASDVYDPPPTSALHTVRGRKQQKSRKSNDRKNGKKGHKSSSSPRSGTSKKHSRRGVGSSDRSYKPLDAALVFQDDSLDGFHVGNPDAFCGSSFLKQSPTKMHFPVAEVL